MVVVQVSSSQVSCWLSAFEMPDSPGFTRSKFSCLKVRQNSTGDLNSWNTETQLFDINEAFPVLWSSLLASVKLKIVELLDQWENQSVDSHGKWNLLGIKRQTCNLRQHRYFSAGLTEAPAEMRLYFSLLVVFSLFGKSKKILPVLQL